MGQGLDGRIVSLYSEFQIRAQRVERRYASWFVL
jgi:hypothetical protein